MQLLQSLSLRSKENLQADLYKFVCGLIVAEIRFEDLPLEDELRNSATAVENEPFMSHYRATRGIKHISFVWRFVNLSQCNGPRIWHFL